MLFLLLERKKKISSVKFCYYLSSYALKTTAVKDDELLPSPRLTPELEPIGTDSNDRWDAFEEFARKHEIRIKSLMKSFEAECKGRTLWKSILLSPLRNR